MKTIIGKPISPGYALGRAVILGAARAEILETHVPPDRIDSELARFRAALDASYRELQQLQARVRSELGPAQSEIFSAHLLFLKDPQFIESVETRIRNGRYSLESAIQVTVDDLTRLLRDADNAYLRERGADMCDLRARLLRHADPSAVQRLAELAPESILIARELLPSDLLELDREHLVGIVTEVSGETGHAAILARALGVPAVTGIADATRIITPDMPILIDGQTGEVVLNPGRQRRDASKAHQANFDRITRDALSASV